MYKKLEMQSLNKWEVQQGNRNHSKNETELKIQYRDSKTHSSKQKKDSLNYNWSFEIGQSEEQKEWKKKVKKN